MTAAVIAICFWLACAAVTYGLTFAFFQREFPELAEKEYRKDVVELGLLALIGGPFGLMGALLFLTLRGFHGFKLW